MLTDVPVTQSPSPRGGTHVHQALLNTMDIKTVLAENSALKSENDTLCSKVDNLESQRETALASLSNGEFTSVEALAAHMKALLQG